MASLLLIAQILGRQNSAARVVFLAAALMLAINPLALKNDWGFQLSFLSTMGLIYLYPFLRCQLQKLRGFSKLGLTDVASATLAAQIFTWPLLVYNVGTVSLVAPLANLLIVPLIPLIMVLGFVLLLVGLVSSGLALILSWPCQLLMSYLITVINWCSQIPFASLKFYFSAWVMFVCYLGLGLWAWRIKKSSHFPFEA
jgi:competence protein ComEC